MNNTLMQSILKDCSSLSMDELRQLNQNVVAMIHSRRDLVGQMKKAEMYVGQRVRTTKAGAGLFVGDEGVIEKINPKKIKVRFDRNRGVYNCPPELIEAV